MKVATIFGTGPACRRAPWIAATVAATLIAGTTLAAAKAGDKDAWDRSETRSGDDFEWHGRLAAGKTIEVKGVNGGIVAEPTSGSQVEVTARKSARKSDPDRVKIEVIEHEDGVTICALYPSPPGDRPNECAPGGEGRMNTRNNDVKVEYRVKVPAGVRFVGRTVNGGIEARGLRADAEAYTVNGSIELTTRGVAHASTVNGSLDVEMGSWDEPLEFETVNGGITLGIPANSGAELRVTTVNGDIQSDFELRLRGKYSRHRLNATIGDGGPQLRISTVNGDIRLRSTS
jgi:hypothetical protein